MGFSSVRNPFVLYVYLSFFIVVKRFFFRSKVSWLVYQVCLCEIELDLLLSLVTLGFVSLILIFLE